MNFDNPILRAYWAARRSCQNGGAVFYWLTAVVLVAFWWASGLHI